MGFPDERDRNLIRFSERVEGLASDLCEWLGQFNPSRRALDLLPIAESDEFEVLKLRRLASNLYTSAKVPVAAAAYGASQVGKSLFMGQVLKATNDQYSPLGRDEQHGPPAYYKDLSFTADLNPQSGSNEATALVTRFTTKDRIAAGVSPECPVMVRALTRAEWLRVLARGFQVECKTPLGCWQQDQLEDLFEQLSRDFPGQQVDRQWRMDLLDSFTYMRSVDPRGFPAKEAILNGLLSRYPLAQEGYVAAAASLFWDKWPSLTDLFVRICRFLERISIGDHDPGILTHWMGVRYLLDSQRTKVHERQTSKCFPRVDWADFSFRERNGWYVLDYQPGSGQGAEDLATIQAGMLEMVIPILPHRLTADWRRVIEEMDFLDIPGMRAVRAGVEKGKRERADTLEEQMEIVKRGKVSYLFERYTDELQIQTLLLLSRYGNLEVKAQMKYHVEKWGKARYGEKVWPQRVMDEIPALFIGMTGIDEEFRNRGDYADKMLYEKRLGEIVDTLGSVMNDFGGRGKTFNNCYPIRYPGTWDTTEAERLAADPEKWARARRAFLDAENVRAYVRCPDLRWDTAMRDDDGGLSLIANGIRAVTTAEEKQNQLQHELQEAGSRLLQLSRGWVVSSDTNVDRQNRIAAAQKILDWLMADETLVYHRVHALQESLGVHEGDELRVADCAEISSKRYGDPLPRFVREFLHEWATMWVPKRWEEYANTHEEGGPWLERDDLNTLARYLHDYLVKEEVFAELLQRLTPVVTLKTRDEAARRRARRSYSRIILNDFLMNPGPGMAPLEAADAGEGAKADHNAQAFQRFGLMASFVGRWVSRLPQALALGAGEHVQVPPGNAELTKILEPWEK